MCSKQDGNIPAATRILLLQGHTLPWKCSTAQLEELQDAARVGVRPKDQESFTETEDRGAWTYETLLLAIWQHRTLRSKPGVWGPQREALLHCRQQLRMLDLELPGWLPLDD